MRNCNRYTRPYIVKLSCGGTVYIWHVQLSSVHTSVPCDLLPWPDLFHLWLPHVGVAEGHPGVHPPPCVCHPLQAAVMFASGLAVLIGAPAPSSGTGSIGSSCRLPCLQAGIPSLWVKRWMVCCIFLFLLSPLLFFPFPLLHPVYPPSSSLLCCSFPLPSAPLLPSSTLHYTKPNTL